MHLKESLLAIIHDALTSLKKEAPLFLPLERKNFLLPKEKKEPAPPVESKTSSPLAKTSSIPPKEPAFPQSEWHLHTELPKNDALDALEKKFGKIFPFQPLPTRIHLLLPKEDAAHRLFLENVSRSLLRFSIISQVVYAENYDWNNPFIAAPLSLLRKKFSFVTNIHRIYAYKEFSFLAMAEIDEYLKDRNQKLHLWNTIKTLPSQLSPSFSSMT